MLALARKPGESIIFEIPPGDYPNGIRIETFFVRIDGKKANVGIDAPRMVRVRRSEFESSDRDRNRRA